MRSQLVSLLLLVLCGCGATQRERQATADNHAQAYVLSERIGTTNAPTSDEMQQFIKASACAWQAMDSDINGWTAIPGSIGMASAPMFAPKPVPKDLNDAWIDKMLAKARSPVEVRSPSGEAVMVNINQGLVDFIQTNRYTIATVGQSVFADFMASMAKGQSQEALLKVYRAMSNRDIINLFIANAVMLGDDSAQQVQVKNFWIDLTVGLASKIEPLAFSAILGSL